MIGQPIADLEKVTEVPSGSTYIANMGDGSGTKAVTQETLTKEVGKGLKVGDLAGLQTENKTSLVAAINEAAQSGGGGSAVDILDTKEEIEANTETGKAAGALAVKEMFSEINDNLVSQKLLIGSIENYNANTRILLNESIFKFSVLIICFTINNRASTIVIEKDYLIKSKCVSYIFASFENVAIGSVHYVDSTHIYLENGFDELQIYGLQ